jgi:SAM-dependent methyltransferase
MSAERISFSFGDNWQRFLDELHPRAVEAQAAYFADWLPESIEGRRFLDIGSGSGIASLVAYQRGAEVWSFDSDRRSVAATSRLRERAGAPERWTVLEGSILDPGFTARLGVFEIVLSWGVLHHTGALWRALDEASALVEAEGLLWIALYTRTPKSNRSLRIKRAYNRLPRYLKPLARLAYAGRQVVHHLAHSRSLAPILHYHEERGMSWWRDIEDWLGGLPYEVSSPEEVRQRLEKRGFRLERLQRATGEGGTDVYLFRRVGATE